MIRFACILSTFSLIAGVQAAEVDVSGSVVDLLGTPVENASVSLVKADLSTTTNNEGLFTLSGESASTPVDPRPSTEKGLASIVRDQGSRIDIFDLRGKRITRTSPDHARHNAATRSGSPGPATAHGAVLVSVRQAGHRTTYRRLSMKGRVNLNMDNVSSDRTTPSSGRAKSRTGFSDTLRVTKGEGVRVDTVISSATIADLRIVLPLVPDEIPPLPSVSSSEQKALIEKLRAKLDELTVVYDNDGNVIRLKCYNGRLDESASSDQYTGVTDSDMEAMLAFYKLESIWLEAQLVTDAGIAYLARFPNLTEARFHYMNRRGAGLAEALQREGRPNPSVPQCTPDFILPLDAHRNLEVLEIKHNFKLSGTSVDKLSGFPALERLVLDNGSAAPPAVDFIVKCPRLRVLQLHRTKFSNTDFEEAVAALPDLEELWLRPDGRMSTAGLETLRGHARLEDFRTEFGWLEGDPDALDPLVDCPALTQICWAKGKAHPTAVKRFAQARPDVTIQDWCSQSRLSF